MNTFNELDRYLAVAYGLDQWSDDAIDHAAELLDGFDEADWHRLERTWRDRPSAWQVRLADAVFGSDKPRVIDLLCQMLKSPEVEVALAAAESLEAKDDVWTPDASLRAVLAKLLNRR
ncbi:hypothetical protein IC235_08535 [Hymenobacter sp. BT664]|uniref:HEAT repeat domain-containing protein n=1 Tax=Hymenobacter montanus TaxID=2771359 RepID=A0A927BD67_9BACT|nr:hypothetical protein [Hymenobacter montanus]MBD2767939.1 hypothetical protein [Hymenobacter montanus]